MHEAKTNLSRLVQEVEAGGRVTIMRNGEPVVELVRVEKDGGVRGFGSMRGRADYPELTDEYLADGDAEVADAFFG